MLLRYFATYEILKRSFSAPPPTLPSGEKAAAPPLSIGAIMLAGGTAGVAMWTLAIPPDVSQHFCFNIPFSERVCLAVLAVTPRFLPLLHTVDLPLTPCCRPSNHVYSPHPTEHTLDS